MSNDKKYKIRRTMSKKLAFILSALSLCIVVTGCSKDNSTMETTSNSNIVLSTDDSDSVKETDTYINLNNGINVTGSGVDVNENKITITKGGTYSVSGTLNDGQIVVNVGDNEKVYIILNNANITCLNNSPIYVINSDKTVIILEDGTENTLTDSENYIVQDENNDEANATIYSRDDLVIKGNGALIVNANYNNGIVSKDDLKIKSGNITVNSVDDGIIGKDGIEILGGNITINAKGDGLRSSNKEDSSKGYVYIENGTVNITAGTDGIQAASEVLIKGGTIDIKSGGGSENSSTTTSGDINASWGNWKMPGGRIEEFTTSTENTEEKASAKGIKAVSNIVIDNGDININSSDDSIHSNNSLTINGGNINISSGDDGIHSDKTLTINNGTINIAKSYEGIEASTINLNGGNISLVSSDDGINASGGNDSSATQGRAGQNNFSSSTGQININGGNISVDANGDGIDANGSVTMTGGVVFINGPTNGGNGALDYDKTFDISGGTLIAAGSLGMAQAPSSDSNQNSVNLTLSQVSAGSLVSVQSSDGENVLTFEVSKSCQSIVISSPKLKKGNSYIVYKGGTSTGSKVDGIYTDGTYSGGEKVLEFTISDAVTNVSESGVNMSSGMGNNMMRPSGESGRGVPPSR